MVEETGLLSVGGRKFHRDDGIGTRRAGSCDLSGQTLQEGQKWQRFKHVHYSQCFEEDFIRI